MLIDIISLNQGLRAQGKNYDAAWSVQLVERQSTVREVEGSSPRPYQHSGS